MNNLLIICSYIFSQAHMEYKIKLNMNISFKINNTKTGKPALWLSS